MSRYIVMTASAKMPASCRGRYSRVAVVETSLPQGEAPKMISDRALGVIRIVETWERLNHGGPRSAYAVALREADALAARLNAEAGVVADDHRMNEGV